MIEWIDLIWTFIKIGVSTFGGGYAMVPVLERELIKKKGWITMTEVMDYYTIAQVTPGIIAVNISTFVGYKRLGMPGGIAATAAFMLPGVFFMTAVSLFVSRFAEYAVVQHAFAGIRIAVGALILDTIRKLFLELFKKEKAPGGSAYRRHALTVCILAAAFFVSVLLSPSPVWIVAGAALAGFLFFRTGSKPATADAAADAATDAATDAEADRGGGNL
ncbi:MAG: chromate transporter [Spirochaetaceae bacterium]|jgi:chromate transporter|nr:chromate transporter [Spirochaetaceae bacterium]